MYYDRHNLYSEFYLVRKIQKIQKIQKGQALFRNNRDIGTTWKAVLKITHSTTEKNLGFRK
jgi:hypothetical protein